MKRSLSLLVAALFLVTAGAAYAKLSTAKVVGDWKGAIQMKLSGAEQEFKIEMDFAKDGTVQVKTGDKVEKNQWTVSGNDLIFWDKDKSKKEAVVKNARITKTTIDGELKPVGESLPPDTSITIHLERK